MKTDKDVIDPNKAGEDSAPRTAEGELTIKRSKKRDIAARIGCVIAAFVIWFYVMATDSTTQERQFDSIAVEQIGSGELSVLSGSSEVTVVVTGRRGVINKLEDSDIKAYADVSGVTTPGWQRVAVEVTAPSGTTVSTVTPSNIMLYFGNRTTVTVPVEIHLTEYTLPENYEIGMGDAVISPSEITVTGPEDLLATIKSARVTLSLGTVSGSVTSKAPLTLVDSDGNTVASSYIKLQTSEATVDIPVYKYVDLPLTLSYRYGYFNSSNIKITAEPSSIRVKGEASAVDKAVWSYTIDEKKITGDGQYTIPVTLSDGITNYSGINEVTLTVEHIGTTTKQITLTDIAVINPDGIEYELGDSTQNITLRGPSQSLEYVNSKNVTATIDLSSFTNATGSVLVPVTITVPDGLSGSVYEIGTYTVSVKLG